MKHEPRPVHSGYTPGPWTTNERVWENGRTLVCETRAALVAAKG
jgi:hypothetical protein